MQRVVALEPHLSRWPLGGGAGSSEGTHIHPPKSSLSSGPGGRELGPAVGTGDSHSGWLPTPQELLGTRAVPLKEQEQQKLRPRHRDPHPSRGEAGGAGSGGLSGHVHSRFRGRPGHASPPGRPSCSRLATPKLAGAPSLAEPGLDVALAAAKPGGLPGGGCTEAGTSPEHHPRWLRRVPASGPDLSSKEERGGSHVRAMPQAGRDARRRFRDVPASPGEPASQRLLRPSCSRPCRPRGLESGFRSPGWR
ncbi:PREDICTED: uncharacterized protein LOC108529270 [Rhinopithecus bieti]|uniref:uncharacterized protein LOC108529270 n=1 Tax=Rhinopithecus bieti TaxID=61621 RepID=UPI00083BF199|nr:PREDICTED: uncharacterized protein LOC108529270 [Rhinopithecus bieti]